MKIEYPTQTTYFICKNAKGEARSYGQVEPDQVMETRYEVDSYLTRKEWEEELIVNGITLEDEILNNTTTDL